MSAFDTCSELERKMMPFFGAFLSRHADGGRYVTLRTGKIARHLQFDMGIDALYVDHAGVTIPVECKLEADRRWGNFYLEVWSNRRIGRRGWLMTSEAQFLLYGFLAEKRVYKIAMDRLRFWALKNENIWKYRLRLQRKHEQSNDTYGACVPISCIQEAVGFEVYDLETARMVANEDDLRPAANEPDEYSLLVA